VTFSLQLGGKIKPWRWRVSVKAAGMCVPIQPAVKEVETSDREEKLFRSGRRVRINVGGGRRCPVEDLLLLLSRASLDVFPE
jgi:hypothetical protein